MKTNQARQLRVSLVILYLPVAIFLVAARSVVVALGGNANYPTPFPALPDITAVLDDLQAKIAAAIGGGKMAIAERNSAWETARTLIRQLIGYVQMHCQNYLAILLSSGFTTTKTPTPIGPLPAPGDLRLSRTDMTGQVLFRFKRVYGTSAGYTVQTAASPDGPFTDYANSGKGSVLIEGRTPLITVWVRVRANGTAGPGPFSEPTCIIVL